MKKADIALILLAGLLVLLGIVVYIGGRDDMPAGDPSAWVETPKVENEAPVQAPDGVKPAIALPTTGNKYTDLGGGLHQVSGKVTNTDSVTRSIMVTVTYYDRNNKPIEGGGASYSEITAGAALDYSVNTGRDVSGFKRFEVQANAY